MIYAITDWDKYFENNRTRELKRMEWIPVPNKHDGDGFTDLLSRENGAALFGAWVLMIQLASKCDPRGVLVRTGSKPQEGAATHGSPPQAPATPLIPHTPESISRITRCPVEIVRQALTACVEIGWIHCIPMTANEAHFPAAGCDMPPLIPQEAAASRARAGMERNGMEQGCGEGKAPCTLEHAIQQAEQIGITTAEADFWWHFRSADGWMKGSKENRRIVGANWHHDAKQFTMSVRQRQGEQGDGGRKPGKAKDEPVWAMKRDLREINKELEAIESERVGVWGNLPEKFQAQKRLLQTQKRTLLGRIEAAEKQST